MKSEDFDKKFDEGNCIIDDLDVSQAKIVKPPQKRISMDMPVWMVRKIDEEAARVGSTRQSVIKFWLADRLDGK